MQALTQRRLSPTRLLWLLALGLLAMVLVSIFVGRYPAPYWMSPTLLQEDTLAQRLVFSLRLPRLLTALLLGMTLSACGTVLQMVFRNPLVEPGFLGVSQGAAFGAACSILWVGSSPVVIELSATFFALLGLFLSYTLARQWRFGGWALRLVLAGIAVSALFSSGVGVLKYMADPAHRAAGNHVLAVGWLVERYLARFAVHAADCSAGTGGGLPDALAAELALPERRNGLFAGSRPGP